MHKRRTTGAGWKTRSIGRGGSAGSFAFFFFFAFLLFARGRGAEVLRTVAGGGRGGRLGWMGMGWLCEGVWCGRLLHVLWLTYLALGRADGW